MTYARQDRTARRDAPAVLALPRLITVEELAERARDIWGEDAVDVAADMVEALDFAVAEADAHLEISAGVLVTGSVVTVADARQLLGRG